MSDFLRKITNSVMVILTLLSPHRNTPRNQPITKITIHHTAGNISLRALLDWLYRATTRASYNYGISSLGEMGLIVEERNRCWASSSAWNDNRAVVIGVANNRGAPDWTVSEWAFSALIDLCVDICYRNPGIVQQDGITRGLFFDGTQNGSLTHHRMFSNTTCPGPYLLSRFPDICQLVNEKLAARLGGTQSAPELTADTAPDPQPAATPEGVTIRVRRTRANNEIVTLDIEEYLRGVVPSEVVPSWGMEVLKAQAIAARSFALQRMERNRNRDFDVDDTTTFQVYNPDRIHPRTDEAVRDTAGMVAVFNGRIAETLYHSSNGGVSVSAAERWGGAGKPYLIAQSDPYTKRERNGHGVGMSQWGAMERAQAGHLCAAILAFYYPGTSLAGNYGRKDAPDTQHAAPPATPPQTAHTAPTTPVVFNAGDIVQFTGGGVYVSSRAPTPAHSRGRSVCVVTQTVSGAPQPYHLISEDDGRVHGWVAAVDVQATGTPPETAAALSGASLDEIAREVIQGRWGNGQDRRNRLIAAGHDAGAIQARVNELMR